MTLKHGKYSGIVPKQGVHPHDSKEGGHLDLPIEGKIAADWLELIAQTGNISQSCLKIGIKRSSVMRKARFDIEFQDRYREAMARYRERLLGEADRRAVKGVKKDIYYKGRKCGRVTEYSDRLLELLLKKHDPEIRDRTTVESLNLTATIGQAQIEQLTPAQRVLLAKMVEEEKHVDPLPTSAPKDSDLS